MNIPKHRDDRLSSVEDVSEYLGVPVATLYQWRCRPSDVRSCAQPAGTPAETACPGCPGNPSNTHHVDGGTDR
jgi:hypothetical protein